MLRFQRALLVEVFLVFLGVLTVVTVVVFAGSTIRLVYRGEGVGTDLVLELLPSLLPIALSYSIPFAWLSAVALVVGRMVSDREVVALRAAGVHLRTVVVPLLAVGCALSVLAMYLSTHGVPNAQREIRAGVRRYLPKFLTSLRAVDRTVTMNNGRFSFSSYGAGAFHDIELDRRRSDGTLDLKILAREATIRRSQENTEKDALEFRCRDAYVIRPAASGELNLDFRREVAGVQMAYVESVGASVLFNEFFGTRRFVERPKDMALPDLLYAVERDGVWRGTRRSVLIALHGRLALGCAPLVLGLFAAAMSLVLPATGRRVRDFLLAFLPPVLVYFPLYLAGPSLGKQGAVPPWLAMWSGNLVVGVAGGLLLVWAYRR